MRKIVLLLVLVLASASVTFAQGKLGHTNFEELIKLLPERATAEKEIQDLSQKLEKRLQTMMTTYQTRVAEIQADTSLSPAMMQSARSEIADLERRIQEFQQTAYTEVETKQQEQMNKLYLKVREAAANVGAENNFTYIFDSNSVLFAGGEDVTPLMKTKLGL